MLAGLLICWLLLSGIGTLAARKDIARRGLVLLAVLHAVAVFIGYNLALSPHYDIRVDIFLTAPLVLVIIGWGVAHAVRRVRPAGDALPPRKRLRR